MGTAPALRELQRWMKDRVQPGRRPAELPGGTPLNPQGGASGEERMAVYAEGYVVRIREALEEVYEAIRHVLGRDAFTGLARDYARRFPSNHYDLGHAGRRLPEFLASHPLTRELPFLPDLARLEWAVSWAFHAFEQAPLSAEELAALSPEALEGARVRFQPSVRLVSSRWPVLEIWEQRKHPREEIRVELEGRPQRVLVFREGVRVRCEALEPAQHGLLESLLAGRPLGEACADLADAEQALSGWFAGWMARRLIIRLEREGADAR